MKNFVLRTIVTIAVILAITLLIAYMKTLGTEFTFTENVIDSFICYNYSNGTRYIGFASGALICSIFINILIQIAIKACSKND